MVTVFLKMINTREQFQKQVLTAMCNLRWSEGKLDDNITK